MNYFSLFLMFFSNCYILCISFFYDHTILFLHIFSISSYLMNILINLKMNIFDEEKRKIIIIYDGFYLGVFLRCYKMLLLLILLLCSYVWMLRRSSLNFSIVFIITNVNLYRGIVISLKFLLVLFYLCTIIQLHLNDDFNFYLLSHCIEGF